MGRDNGGEKGEGFSGRCIKDTWTKPKGGRIKGGKWGWLGWRENGDNYTWTVKKNVKKKHPTFFTLAFIFPASSPTIIFQEMRCLLACLLRVPQKTPLFLLKWTFSSLNKQTLPTLQSLSNAYFLFMPTQIITRYQLEGSYYSWIELMQVPWKLTRNM